MNFTRRFPADIQATFLHIRPLDATDSFPNKQNISNLRPTERRRGGTAEVANSSGQIFLGRCSAARVGKCDTISDDANLGSERIPGSVK